MEYNLEDIEKQPESLESEAFAGLTDTQTEYLRELSVPTEEWQSMCKEERNECLGRIVGRFSEMNLPENIDKGEYIGKIFGFDIQEAYYQMEAPHDHIQIEQISDTIAEYDALKYENWTNLELSERVDVLNQLEQDIAAIEHRTPCPIRPDFTKGPLSSGWCGGYSPSTKGITLNADFFTSNDPNVYRELIDTVIHEGRHAYQDYNLNVCEVHPRHSEVVSWSDTMGDGKWEYWGDCSSILGQRLYEQQSIEIDARNFAADVISNVQDKLFA